MNVSLSLKLHIFGFGPSTGTRVNTLRIERKVYGLALYGL